MPPVRCLYRATLPFLVCLAVSATSAAATRYGEDFVRLGAAWREAPLSAGPAEGSVGVADDTRGRTALQQRLEALEMASGPYTGALAEPLMDLGRLHRRRGDLEQADRLFQRALHVVRINDGLDSDRQLPLLRELLAIHRQQGDWAALDSRYEYYYRRASDSDDSHLDAALGFLRWQREALRLGLDSREERRLLELVDLNEALLLQAGDALSPSALWPLLESQLHNLYLVQAWQAPVVMQRDTGLRTGLYDRQPMELSTHEQRLVNLQRGAVSRGVELLEAFLARAELQEVELRARVSLALADWEHWNGRQRSALERYRQLAAWLASRGRQDLRDAWFGEPVELPDNGVFWRDPGEGGLRMTADYSVSPEGRARSVSTRAGEEGERSHAIRLYRQLLSTRFRPAFGDRNEPVEVTGLSRDYLVAGSS